ncbi:MAG: 2-amino-4-hydroxy-6-hydroxymethyldihydropteridine diphosphokinase, partial [Hyphomicrobiales bacterium]
FFNGVVLLATDMQAPELLVRLHAIESRFGRDRTQVNAPRTLDLDLIAHGRTIGAAPALPHPRAADRLFVMGPLAEIAPSWRHPVSGLSAATLANAATVGLDAVPI